MALRISLCSLTGIVALLLGSHDAVAILLLHDQFLEAGPLAGMTPNPGPGAVWNPAHKPGSTQSLSSILLPPP